VGDLEATLQARLRGGGRAFVPYVTGGAPGFDAALLRDLRDAGADAIEVGIPFSDPVMDGGVIQEASRLALQAGATPASVLATVREAELGVPVAVMTYANPVWRHGHEAFLQDLVGAGVCAAIVPDLPVDEAADWIRACDRASVEPVLLAAPGTSDQRLGTIAGAARGFVYCVATYGVTGARDRLQQTAPELVSRLRPLTDRPLLVGVGIGTPEQAAEAAAFADGVIVGSALVRLLLAGDRAGALDLAGTFRRALGA
jgi:tryptophan synthase alpha chain